MRFSFSIFSTLIFIASQARAEEPKVEYKPYSIWGVQELGMIQSGIELEQHQILRDEWVDHLGASISKGAIVNERLRLEVGIGLVFQFPKPEKVEPKFGGSQYKIPYVGPSIAEAEYSFGDLGKPIFKLGFGIFPYKYNPQAYNLGEYLFRSTAYPNTITTGGLVAINSSAVHLQGTKARFSLGDFTLDGLLLTETSFPPFFDIALAFLANYNFGNGLLELGTGVHFKHLIPVDPDITTPNVLANSYFDGRVPIPRSDNSGLFDTIPLTLSGNSEYYSSAGKFYVQKSLDPLHVADSAKIKARGDSLIAIGNYVDTFKPTLTPDDPNYRDHVDSILNSIDAQYYTNRSVFLMGRAALDLKKIFGEPEILGHEDLKIYSEIGLLGVENYPIYYENRVNRTPVMFGFNFPAFKILDLLAVQFEYYDSPYLNSHLSIGKGSVATPTFPNNKNYSGVEYLDVTGDDNLSWTLLAKKQLLPGVFLSGQFARDHYRAIATNIFYGSRQEAVSNLFRGKDWYWMFQLSWSM